MPDVAVVVAGTGSCALLERCISALERNSGCEFETIVITSAPNAKALAAKGGRARIVESDSHDPRELRAIGIGQTEAPLIAITRDAAIPSSDWLRSIVALHRGSDAAAIGGPVLLDREADLAHTVVWTAEYGRLAATRRGPARDLAATNVSYKRRDLPLEEIRNRGLDELWLHQRLLSEGKVLQFEPDLNVTVDEEGGFRALAAARVEASRQYARARYQRGPGALLHLVATPLLPFVLASRTAGAAARAGRFATIVRGLPLLFAYHAAGAFGEAVGYAQSLSRSFR